MIPQELATFHRWADLLPEPLLVVTGSGKVHAANRSAGTHLPAEWVQPGAVLSRVVGRSQQDLERWLKRCCESRQPVPFCLIGPTDSSVGSLECSGSVWIEGSHPDEIYLLLRFEPSSGAQQRARDFTAAASSLFRISEHMSAELDLKRMIEVLTDEATKVCGAQVGAFFYNRSSKSGDRYTLFSVSGVDKEPFSRYPLPRATDLFRPTFDGQIVRSGDITKHPLYRASSGGGNPDGAYPIRSYLAVPVIARSGEVHGALLIGHRERNAFDEVDERVVAAIASQAAVAIDNAKLLQRAHQTELRYRELADAMPQIVWTATPDGEIDYFSKRWYELTGLDEASSIGEGWLSALHPDDRERCQYVWRTAVKSQTVYEIEYRFRDLDNDTYRWYLARAFPVIDSEKRTVRWIGTCTDIHRQKISEQSLQFLSQASKELASLVNVRSTLQRLAHLAVPLFADCAVVDLTTPSGNVSRVEIAHMNPEKCRIMHLLNEQYPLNRDSPYGSHRVVRTGRTEFMSNLPDAVLQQIACSPEHLKLLRRLGLLSYICVPITVRDRRIGAFTFFTSDSGRHYSPDDVFVAEDLAHRAAIAVENAKLYQEVRQADRRKDEFLAMLAHELRNPLAPIRNAVHILGMPNLDESTAEQARDIMRRQVDHMVRLVDDLLDVSRIMRGKIDLRKEPVYIAEIVGRAVETVQPLIESRQHQLNLDILEQPLLVQADPVRLSQVVANLLSNAAKYTDMNGEITIAVRKEEDQAVIAVRDNGIGIDEHLLPHVFDLFTQAEVGRDRSLGGLGIGLTLVRRLVEMHEGRVAAHSEGPGTGSEFLVYLPLSKQAPRPRPAIKLPKPEPDQRQRRILIVEDSEDSAKSLARILTGWGHTVDTVDNGLNVHSAAINFRPDVILLDIGLPGMDGYAVARQIRNEPRLQAVKLVAMTGYGTARDRKLSEQAGFDTHLVKPVDLVALESLLSNGK